ncbi:heavy-metal-associated domain-containing protein [Brevibacterium casei]|uniref:HMA domain-containing protein n=1 Tax=Brevibacterium metallidurans TaxID=1482676 RepID=A0ABN0SMB1_9MICO|nr:MULTISPECIES: heavy-metal-associated domain-containing protein [Micrococcales]MBN9606284.1 heavy-metal-associated domain-containing protein [Actinomycetales bacterium]MCT1447709.1 heavy-metal-associated domain-containing protein [Brevibacterium casei]MCT2019980.1 heavy-metal-associated domain-containing protein [Kocuria marina]
MSTHTFRVEDIHCGGCESAIGKALTRLGGVSDVAADSATNQVTVRYDESQTSTEQIAERLATAGYPVIG